MPTQEPSFISRSEKLGMLERIVARLIEMRTAWGLTQTDLAEILGFKLETMQRLEKEPAK